MYNGVKIQHEYTDENIARKTQWIITTCGTVSNSTAIAMSAVVAYASNWLMQVYIWTMDSLKQVTNTTD